MTLNSVLENLNVANSQIEWPTYRTYVKYAENVLIHLEYLGGIPWESGQMDAKI